MHTCVRSALRRRRCGRTVRRAETSGRWQHSRVLATLRRRGHLMRPRVVDQNVRHATADGENCAVSRGRHSRIGGFSFHVNPRPFPAGPPWSEFKSLRSVSDGIYLPHTPLLSGEYDTHREAPENSFFSPKQWCNSQRRDSSTVPHSCCLRPGNSPRAPPQNADVPTVSKGSARFHFTAPHE